MAFHGEPSENPLGVLRTMPRADLSSWLTKEQAAAAIGCSTKFIEQLAREKQLQQAKYRRPSGGPRIRVYHPQDVERIRRERNPEAPAFVVPPAGAGEDLQSPSSMAIAQPAPRLELLELLAGILAVLRSEKSQTLPPASEKSEKLFLTLDEAAEVSGLPRTYLRRLIADGKLEAIKARGWRIRRRDLEAL